MSLTETDNRVSMDLTIVLSETPAGPHHEFTLVVADGLVQERSRIPDPQAALAAVEQYGQGIFFPEPGPPRICTQQYGGPQRAVITGTLAGKTVRTELSLTDGCEIARWRALAPLLGGTPGSRGAV